MTHPLGIPPVDQLNRTVRTDADRAALMARYPWRGWGHPTYAHRSLLCGAGEPPITTEPAPSRQERSLDVLTFNDVDRCVLEVGFPIDLRPRHWKHKGQSTTHPWWHKVLDSGDGFVYYGEPANGPRLDGTEAREAPPCPMPLSDTSVWPVILDVPGDTVGNPVAGPKPKRKMFLFRNLYHTSPGDMLAENTDSYSQGAWQHTPETFTYRSNIRRKCTRILVYNRLTENQGQTGFVFFDSGEPWNPSTPSYIGRKGAMDRHQHPARMVDPGDIRYRPWGFTDQAIPDWSRPHKGGDPALQFESYHFSPHDQGPPGISIGGSGLVSQNVDLPSLDADMIYNGYLYAAMPWSRSAWPDGEAIRSGCDLRNVCFTLVIESDFYEYIVYKMISGDGWTKISEATDEPYETPYQKIVDSEELESGYAGAYGRMFIIY